MHKKEIIKNIARGFVMGSADVVPGVSGGTMALILGIYEKLINSIRTINKKTLKLFFNFKWKVFFKEIPTIFLGSLAFGILLAVFTLAKPIEWLLDHNPSLVWAFFFGLVLASILVVKNRIKTHSFYTLIVFLIGVVVAYIIAGLLPAETAATPILFFISGAIAISAMILPGISGSFLLVIMGKYEQVLSAVNNREIDTLFIFLCGIIVGLLLFAKFLSWLLHNYHDLTMATLVGLMFGSLRKIWPWKIGEANIVPTDFSINNFYLLLLVILGMATVFLLQKLANNK